LFKLTYQPGDKFMPKKERDDLFECMAKDKLIRKQFVIYLNFCIEDARMQYFNNADDIKKGMAMACTSIRRKLEVSIEEERVRVEKKTKKKSMTEKSKKSTVKY